MDETKKLIAIKMRKNGYTYDEISSYVLKSKSTISKWLKNIMLTSKTKNILKEKAIHNKQIVSKKLHQNAIDRSQKSYLWGSYIISQHKFNTFDYQLICSLLYWGEGSKTGNRVEFTNSDPEMIKIFIKSLILGFNIDINKIKANLHLHEHHSEAKQIKFWSKITNLPIENFNKTFWKQNSQKIIRKGYPGCIRLCYYSKEVVDRIKAIYQNIPQIGP